MILNDNLYKITNEPTLQEASVGVSYIYEICMQSSSVVYQAHFPEEAITPGACLVGIVKELTERCVGRGLQIEQIKNLKFLRPLYPTTEGPTVSVALKFSSENSVQGELRVEEVVICKMTLSFCHLAIK